MNREVLVAVVYPGSGQGHIEVLVPSYETPLRELFERPVILPDRWIADFEKIAIKPDVRPLVMRENAVRLLKLRAPSSPPKPS